IPDIHAAYAAGLKAEQLTAAYLARIAAYDKQGPAINAVLTLNPRAMDEARARDAARKAGQARGLLFGIPVLLKDNIDIKDMPTAAGSQLLAGAVPSEDAVIVRRLREAGAIILGKANMGEFAGGGSVNGDAPPDVRKAGAVPMGYSTLGGQTLNPHDLSLSPLGSSSGSAAAVAAVFAPLAIGTDTSGSIRAPAAANGVVGYRPTHGLVDGTGLIPLAPSLDAAGPITRHVADAALALSVLSNRATPALVRPSTLRGARIGILRDFIGQDAGADEGVMRAVTVLKNLGAVLIDPVTTDVHAALPGFVNAIIAAEFKASMDNYLYALGPSYPHSFAELVAKANDPQSGYASPAKAFGLKYIEETAGNPISERFTGARYDELVRLKRAIAALFEANKLDAVLYPTLPRGIQPLKMPDMPNPPAKLDGRSALYLATLWGAPDIAFPGAVTDNNAPVSVSLMARPGADTALLGYAQQLEQAMGALALPEPTPKLASDVISY
ncbi:MAG: hypothetical protein JNK21_07625, partial [Rhodospirillaceae bacterium]|nr:hypothetical protein [Rhodospirillaceae bacterium]